MNMQDNFPTVAKAALECAARGWHVFPARIKDGSKRSFIAGKANGGARWGATTDPDAIRDYWKEFPDALLGVTTGTDSGFFVIDADTPEGHDKDGVGTLRGWIEEHGPLPDTIEGTTPSEGWHVYFRLPDDLEIRNSESKLAPGIDVRGEGGMVLAPPTIKPGTGKAYRWKNPPGFFELADCPEWLLDKLRAAQAPKLSECAMPGARIQIDTGGATAWAEKAMQDELAKLLAAPEGKRNGTLNSCAFNLAQIVAGGGLQEETVKARLQAAGAGIGLEASEIAATIESGFQAGVQTPRKPKERASYGATGTRAATADGQPRPNTPDETDLSHDALATDLGARSFDADARHVATWGKWLFWEGTRWQIDDRLDHLTRTRAYLRDRAENLTGWAERKAGTLEEKESDRLRAWAKDQSRWLRNKITVASVESLARSNPASVARADAFDENRLLLGTPGGTVDLRTGQLRAADRGDMITKATTCAPAAPGSRPQRWLTFLHEIFDGDADLVAFMQRAAGYALTGLTTEHKLLFLYGTGRNGKSVFLNTLTHIWADYARRAAAETFLNSAVEKHSTGLAGLQGARLVAGSELPVGKTWDESVIKDLTGGDRMTARFMRGDFFDFDPQLTLMIAGNNQPSFRGVDEAIRARVVLVPFTVTIPPERRDKGLADKLRAEGPEILRWAIEGTLQWQERGLDVPARVAAASTEYMDDEDTLGQFLIDETVTDPAGFVTTTDLHDRFKFWCERQGLHAWTLHTLRKELKSRGFQNHRRPHGRGFIGLKTR
ncbi:phage/plasmid primase, P4 family [Oceaniglobus ichthyenteri]|uniref:phage/plasmid primase, P4 family n=1 Tax=Oceaniglobus ichthyenteri TaxID=2136177 RepID=UPI000D3A5647|nr:phage/plasmid primase, P4 family [Oceaniglobus ichthyenteri]